MKIRIKVNSKLFRFTKNRNDILTVLVYSKIGHLLMCKASL